MKVLPLFLILFSIAICAPTYGQKVKKADEISALKLRKEFVKKFQNVFKNINYTIDKEGFLRPIDGYEIILSKERKHFVLKPNSMQEPSLDNVDVVVIGGVTVLCHCGFGAGDDCSFKKLLHDCEGTCDCGIIQFIDFPEILKIETHNGDRLPPSAFDGKRN